MASSLEMMSDDELLDEFFMSAYKEFKSSLDGDKRKAATHRLRVAAEINYRMEHAR